MNRLKRKHVFGLGFMSRSSNNKTLLLVVTKKLTIINFRSPSEIRTIKFSSFVYFWSPIRELCVIGRIIILQRRCRRKFSLFQNESNWEQDFSAVNISQYYATSREREYRINHTVLTESGKFLLKKKEVEIWNLLFKCYKYQVSVKIRSFISHL